MYVMNESNLLIHKYKPRRLDDFENIQDTVQLLRKYISYDVLNVLIIGMEGTGKTSLLDAVVIEYYNSCKPELYASNVLRINSLYEHGISYFRTELQHFCKTCSTVPKKKKMILIDDIDQLPELSQSILVNILDKYKSKINIIASCGNINKITSSMQSRLIMISMPPPTYEYLYTIAMRIINTHNIEIDILALPYLIMSSSNKINTLINYFEKIVLYDRPVTIEILQELCGHMNIRSFETYIEYIQNRELQLAIDKVYDIYDSGLSVIDILDSFFNFIKTSNLEDMCKYKVIHLISKYVNIFYNIHEDNIELALFTNELFRIIT